MMIVIFMEIAGDSRTSVRAFHSNHRPVTCDFSSLLSCFSNPEYLPTLRKELCRDIDMLTSGG